MSLVIHLAHVTYYYPPRLIKRMMQILTDIKPKAKAEAKAPGSGSVGGQDGGVGRNEERGAIGPDRAGRCRMGGHIEGRYVQRLSGNAITNQRTVGRLLAVLLASPI
jgi:hypothetical protein